MRSPVSDLLLISLIAEPRYEYGCCCRRRRCRRRCRYRRCGGGGYGSYLGPLLLYSLL